MERCACELCLEPFDETERSPKILTCGHTFCSLCLSINGDDGKIVHCHRCGEHSFQTKPNYDILRCLKIATSSDHFSDILTPPDFPKPDNEKAILQVPKCEFCEENNAYSYCQNCTKLKYLCDDCFPIRHRKSPLDEHTRVPWKAQYRNPTCEVHDQECLIFCKTDSLPICTLCNYGEHAGHDTCLMDSEIVESENRIKKKLSELEKKTRNLRTVSLEANRIYILLCGNSLLDSDKEQGIGIISQVTQEIHSHFYALRHLLQQKEDELINLVKEKAQEKLSKLSRQVDDAATYLTKSYIFDQSIHRFFAEMPHYWVLENEPLILQHLQKLINNDDDKTGLLLYDHVVTSPEILFQSIDASAILDNYRIQSEVILPIQPLSTQQSSESHTPAKDNGDKINDFLSDPLFSCSPEAIDMRTSKFYSIVEEEPYICYPGVTKHLTICSVNTFNEKIVVGGGGGELFQCTLEKQDLGVPLRRGSGTSPSKRTSSRRSVTPPHFRHTSAPLSSQKSQRSSTPPPAATHRSKTTSSASLPRTSSGSSLHSFGSHSTLSTPKKYMHTFDSISSISPRQILEISPASPCQELQVVDNNDGTYSIAVLAQKQGLYRLNITLSGEHIRGSPYILHSEEHTGVIGSKGSAVRYFSTPYGVHFHQETDQLFVSDSSNNRIQIFSSNGEFINSFGTHGRANGQFSWPLGLCVCHDRIYVSDNMNNRIQIFGMDGTFVNSIGLNTKTHTQLVTPYDICCCDDFVFIADSGNKRVQIHTTNGDFVRSIAFKGKQRLFSGPIGVCCGDGLLYVSDHNYNRILVFTMEGEYLRSIGSKGSNEGELYLPHGLAYSDGLLYVSDSGNNRIQVFSKDGEFIRVIGRKGIAPGQFSYPRGISIGNRFAYVADSNNHRIQYFPVNHS